MTATLRSLRTLVFAFACVTPIGVSACGGDDDDDGEPACETAGHAICERGCECREGEGCGVTPSSGDTALTVGSGNLADCETRLITVGCSGGGNAEIDYDACTADLADAVCSGTDDRGGVTLPVSCEP